MAVLDSEVEYDDSGTGAISFGSLISQASVRYQDIGNGSVSLPPTGGELRVVVVRAGGTVVNVIENAVVQPVKFTLNSWESWSFSLSVADPKSKFILELMFREAQLWWGDTLLSWGPMSRPKVANGTVSVDVVGAMWHLSRRHVGKANRDNLLANPNFNQGLSGWRFDRGKFFLDFQRLEPSHIREYGPTRDGSVGLEFNSAIARYYVPPPSLNGGNFRGTHTVSPGQTLWSLGQLYFGSGIWWTKIYEQNAAAIQADAVEAGVWNPYNPGSYIKPGRVLDIYGYLPWEPIEFPPDEPFGSTRWAITSGTQEFVINGGQRGVTLTMTGWMNVPSEYFIDWAEGFGVLLARLPLNYRENNYFTRNGLPNTWGGGRGGYTEIIEYTSSRLGEGHPMDAWIRHECSITVPAGATERVVARISSISGKTYWDQTSLTADTALEFFDTDQAQIIQGLVAHAQDPAFQKDGVINISTSAPSTGVRRDLVALHSEHAGIWDLINDHTQYEKGIDVGMVYTPTQRILTTHYPYKGRTRSSLHLRLHRNISSYDWAFDGEAAASSTIVLGSGSGSDREEAAAINTSAYSDGVILESVEAVGPEIPVDRLREVANELGAVNLNPITLNVTTYPHSYDDTERRFIGALEVGDHIPVTILDGAQYDDDAKIIGYNFYVDNVFRIVGITINPDGTLVLDLNRRDFGNA